MAFTLKVEESTLEGNTEFANSKGNHECAVFVQKATGAPGTSTWKKGDRVMDKKNGEIPKGTAISTFDEDGKYPSAIARHAAVYICHDAKKITVYDQWNKQGKVLSRSIYAKGGAIRKVDDADCYYIIL